MKYLIYFFFLFITCQSKTFSLRELQATIERSSVDIPNLGYHDNNVDILKLGYHDNGECKVIGYDAGCCQHLEVDQISLNSTFCINVTYLPSDYGVSLTLTMDNKTLVNETVSARSPPAICAELPYTKELASVCIKFHDLDITKSSFKGCVKIIIDLAYITIADKELGCFTIPPQGQRSRLLDENGRSSLIRVSQNSMPTSASVARQLGIHDNGGCDTIGFNAGCCQRLEIDPIHLNAVFCVNVSYLPEDYGISLTVTVDSKTIINETVSARAPPAICVDIPYTKELASICIKFHDIDVTKSSFKGCVKLRIELVYITIENIELGCFVIPPKGQRSRFINGSRMTDVLQGQRLQGQRFGGDGLKYNRRKTFLRIK